MREGIQLDREVSTKGVTLRPWGAPGEITGSYGSRWMIAGTSEVLQAAPLLPTVSASYEVGGGELRATKSNTCTDEEQLAISVPGIR